MQREVMLHGLIRLDENNDRCRDTGLDCVSEEHIDADDTPDIWSVWVRVETPGGPEPFTDAPEYERDFEKPDDARAYAHEIAEHLGVDVEEY